MSIRKLVRNNNIGFLGLVETKHRISLKNRMRYLWGNDEFELYESFASETYAGGIVCAWDPGILNVSHKHVVVYWTILEGNLRKLNFDCCLGIIYVPSDRVERLGVFQEIKDIIISINRPVLLLGDFNVILHPDERYGTFRCDLSMRELSIGFKIWV